MKKSLIVLLAIVIFCGCKEETKIDTNYVIAKFQEHADNINSLEYRMQRIDTFAQGGTVWDNSGIALIEKDDSDEIFGFSFYGKRDDVDKEYIYDEGKGFEISKKDSSYQVEPGHLGFMGKPGGQMVHQNIFRLDSVYKKVSVSATENSYLLSFEFENDSVYNVSDKKKVYELNKTDFFPIKIKQTSNRLGNKSVSIAKFTDVKINENVKNSINDIKQGIQNYTIIPPKKRKLNKLLTKKLPTLELPDLSSKDKMVKVTPGQLTLIDFWEVWCGPCIASFPKVEHLKIKYPNKLNVIGIVSEDPESALKMVRKKGTTFQNLVGNNELEEEFGVNSWPRYFLVDKTGIVQKEYFGFSDQIEKDIKEFLAK